MKVKFNIFMIISITMNLVFMLLFLYIGYIQYYPNLNKLIKSMPDGKKKNDHHYAERKSLFEMLPNTEGEIIFLGSSKTEYCEWAEIFGNPRIKNRGISSDNTEGILQRINELVDSNPAKIFIMIGANDLRKNMSVLQVLENYKKIIKDITVGSPSTSIYLQSVLPVNYSKLNQKTSIANLNLKILKLNQELELLCNAVNIHYVDYWPILVGGGQLKSAYTIDGVHLTGEAYLLMKSVLEKYVTIDE